MSKYVRYKYWTIETHLILPANMITMQTIMIILEETEKDQNVIKLHNCQQKIILLHQTNI